MTNARLAFLLARASLRRAMQPAIEFIERFWTHPRITVGVPGAVTSSRLGDPEPTRSETKRARRLARLLAWREEKGYMARVNDMIRYCRICGSSPEVFRENILGIR